MDGLQPHIFHHKRTRSKDIQVCEVNDLNLICLKKRVCGGARAMIMWKSMMLPITLPPQRLVLNFIISDQALLNLRLLCLRMLEGNVWPGRLAKPGRPGRYQQTPSELMTQMAQHLDSTPISLTLMKRRQITFLHTTQLNQKTVNK